MCSQTGTENKGLKCLKKTQKSKKSQTLRTRAEVAGQTGGHCGGMSQEDEVSLVRMRSDVKPLCDKHYRPMKLVYLVWQVGADINTNPSSHATKEVANGITTSSMVTIRFLKATSTRRRKPACPARTMNFLCTCTSTNLTAGLGSGCVRNLGARVVKKPVAFSNRASQANGCKVPERTRQQGA
jgi:hypothetical protein